MSTYKEKLLHPKWQKKRLDILSRDKFTCQICGSTEDTLHIHHRRYIPNLEPWECPEQLLVTLCASCHELEKEEMEQYISLIIRDLKDKFFGDDIREIAYGFNSLTPFHQSDVMASVIAWSLSNPKVMRKLSLDYFKELSKKKKK